MISRDGKIDKQSLGFDPVTDLAGNAEDTRKFSPLNEHVINVLFADWTDDMYEMLQDLQIEHRDIRVIGIATDCSQLMDHLDSLFPEVIVVAYGLPGMNTIQLITRLVRERPMIPVLVMVDERETDRISQLIQAGAKDAFVKPLTLDELADKIRKEYHLEIQRREQEREAQRRRAEMERAAKTQERNQPHVDSEVGFIRQRQQIVAFYSPKGGVGTSVIAVNTALTLARYLARPEIREHDRLKVCLVDCDFGYGNLDTLLMIPNKTNIYDVTQTYDAATGRFDPHALDKAIVRHPSVALDVLLAPSNIELHDAISGEHIQALLSELKAREYDIIICDTSCDLRDTTYAVLKEAQKIFFVVTQDLAALRTTEQVIDLLTGPMLGIRRSAIRLVLSQLIQGNGILPSEIADYLKLPLVATIPEDRRLVTLSINTGKPLALGQPNPVINAIRRVASQISPELGLKFGHEEPSTGGGGLMSVFGFAKSKSKEKAAKKVSGRKSKRRK